MSTFELQIQQLERNENVFNELAKTGEIKHGEWAVIVKEKLVKTGTSEKEVLQGIDGDCYCARVGYEPEPILITRLYFYDPRDSKSE